MNLILTVCLLVLSNAASADFGSVGGGLSGAGAVGSNLPTYGSSIKVGETKFGEGFGMFPLRNPILVCILDSNGFCYNLSGDDLKPLQFAAKMGYSKVYNKFIFHCDDGFGNICMLLEVSK